MGIHIRTNSIVIITSYGDIERMGEMNFTSAYSINMSAKKFEDEGNIEKAKELYWKNVNRGFIGVFPYDRLRIIYSKEKNWFEAIRVCEAYLNVTSINEKEKRKMINWILKYKRRIGDDTDLVTTERIIKKMLSSTPKSTPKKKLKPNSIKLDPFPAWAKTQLQNIQVPRFETHVRRHAVDFMSSTKKILYFFPRSMEKWISCRC